MQLKASMLLIPICDWNKKNLKCGILAQLPYIKIFRVRKIEVSHSPLVDVSVQDRFFYMLSHK